MRGNKTQDMYSMTEEDRIVPEFKNDPVRTQQWKELMALVGKHNIYRAGVIKGGRTFGAPAVMKLILDIVEENVKRVEKKLPKVQVSATFRQRIRKWNSTEKEEAADMVQELHFAEVEASHANGYRPKPDKLLEGVAELVASDDDDNARYTAKELDIAGRFLKSLAS